MKGHHIIVLQTNIDFHQTTWHTHTNIFLSVIATCTLHNEKRSYEKHCYDFVFVWNVKFKKYSVHVAIADKKIFVWVCHIVWWKIMFVYKTMIWWPFILDQCRSFTCIHYLNIKSQRYASQFINKWFTCLFTF